MLKLSIHHSIFCSLTTTGKSSPKAWLNSLIWVWIALQLLITINNLPPSAGIAAILILTGMLNWTRVSLKWAGHLNTCNESGLCFFTNVNCDYLTSHFNTALWLRRKWFPHFLTKMCNANDTPVNECKFLRLLYKPHPDAHCSAGHTSMLLIEAKLSSSSITTCLRQLKRMACRRNMEPKICGKRLGNERHHWETSQVLTAL